MSKDADTTRHSRDAHDLQSACQRGNSLRSTLLACQRIYLQPMLIEVKELIRKHDYHASAEPRGEEMTAWRPLTYLWRKRERAMRKQRARIHLYVTLSGPLTQPFKGISMKRRNER